MINYEDILNIHVTSNLQFIQGNYNTSSDYDGMVNNNMEATTTEFEVIFWHPPGDTNKNYGKPQSSWDLNRSPPEGKSAS
jgi:hypothetical protein